MRLKTNLLDLYYVVKTGSLRYIPQRGLVKARDDYIVSNEKYKISIMERNVLVVDNIGLVFSIDKLQKIMG